MNKFSKNAKFLRLVNGYNQQEIANLLHISRATYMRLEYGKTALSLDQIYTLSSFYGITFESFVTYDISQFLLETLPSGLCSPKPFPQEIVHKNIKLLRLTKGLSQESVASTIHLSRATYSAYETGVKTPDVHTLLLLSALFKIDIDILINNDLCNEP